MVSNSELRDILRATLKLYKESIVESIEGVRIAWPGLFAMAVHFVIILLITALFPFRSMAGSILMGLVFTLLLSNYFVFVEAAVHREQIVFSDLWPKTLGMFYPVVNVLFGLWMLSLVAGLVLPTDFLRAVLNLLVMVLLNPLPENTYINRGGFVQSAEDSVEFVKENWLEWLFPIFLLMLPIAARLGWGNMLVVISGRSPMDMRWLVDASMFGLLGFLPLPIAVFLLLCFTHIFMVFRGVLFEKLSQGTRRNRLYRLRASA